MKKIIVLFLLSVLPVLAEEYPTRLDAVLLYDHEVVRALPAVPVDKIASLEGFGLRTWIRKWLRADYQPRSPAEYRAMEPAAIAWQAASQYPDPLATTSIFDFDNDMDILGTATIVADKYLNLYVCTNSASPRHEWVLQKIELKGADQRKKTKIAEVKDVKGKAEAAQSVPALRAEVARLAELIKQIAEGK